jgi:transcriptional regulator, XRE family
MKKIIKNPLSNRIKELREERNWTQMQLAQETGLAKPLISMIETGERFPSDEVLKKLCNAFKVAEEDILNDDVKQAALEQISNAETREILTAYRKIYRG